MGRQLLGHPAQSGGQPLGAEPIQALGDDPQGVIHLGAIALPALFLTRLSGQ